MGNRYDVIVIGVGTMGAAACYHLAGRGVRVLGIEQFAIGHSRGAHHGHSRMIRLAYYEHPHYVPLLKRTCTLFDELQRDAGDPLLHRVGGLYIGRRESEIVAGAVRSSEAHNLPHELLDRPALAARYGQFHLPDDHVGFFETNAGVLIPERVMDAHVQGALKRGGQLRSHETVRRWQQDSRGVSVTTDRDTYHADRVIFAGGAWSSHLLADLKINLTVTRQTMAWYWPRVTEPFEPGNFPAWFIESQRGCGHYGFPLLPGQAGVKIALHQPGPPTTADTIDRRITREDEAPLRAALERYIPQAAGQLLAVQTCLYTNSPDHHFIVDTCPGSDRVIVACGFSGHGFKFAAVIGEALADLATTGKTDHPIAFLGLSRFA